MRRIWLISLFTLVIQSAFSQSVDLNYYLPDIAYDPAIPTPKSFLGHEVGEWHVSHDKLYYYAKTLAEKSDRLVLTEYARSHEGRPLIYLTITSPANHQNIEFLRTEHKKLTNTQLSGSVNIEDLPIVLYQGCSIHGNEPSGANAGLAMMYYLAAAQGDRINKLLDEAIILFDPSFNPDGLQRFSTWVNTHKGKHLISDPNSREYNEVWPRGRTNHYWFDLNRDWLLLTHPESRGRIETFHQWKPDILTDHHEMGSNSTFFYQPGIPSRTNPNTPDLNQVLTAKIGDFHGQALDAIGSLYYTKESFDDFYYGKGSTYPDAQGSIGILFEQASSRGHLQETDNGLLTFPFTIRNQVTTMFSTQDAGLALRTEILEYKRASFLEARELAKTNPVKGYVFGDKADPARVNRFVDILLRHQIEVHQLNADFQSAETLFKPAEAYVVSLDQDQYRLAKSIFERVEQFEDSLFYDVSAWTMPLAFNIPYAEIRANPDRFLGEEITEVPAYTGGLDVPTDTYAYLVDWEQFNAPRFLAHLKKAGVIVKLAHEEFTTQVDGAARQFDRGTLIIPSGNNQTMAADDLKQLVTEAASKSQTKVMGVSSGLVSTGVNLGSRSLGTIDEVRPLMVIGPGVSSGNAGELWHHFDQVLGIPVPMIEADDLGRVKLSDYNLIIMPDGSYNNINNRADAIKTWLQQGGRIVAIQGAIRWLKSREIISLDDQTVEMDSDGPESGDYAGADEARGARVTGGMIAQTKVDLTHPLFYGYDRNNLPVFKRGNAFYKPVSNIYRTPARYTDEPVLSGYLHPTNKEKMKGSAAVFTANVGRGIVIGLVDDPVFRGYWWGSAKLLANAYFFANEIN